MKRILLLMLIFTIFGCSQKEEEAPQEKSGVELIAIGPLNFGGVLVGEFRDAAVRVINYGPEDLDISKIDESLINPFKIKSISNPCSGGVIPVDGDCIISIRFEPTVAGQWSQLITIGDSSISTNGKGLIGGLLTVDSDTWELGQFVAGAEFFKTLTFTNEGDFSIIAPNVDLVEGTSIGLTTCGDFIAAGKTCTIEIVANKVIAGTYDEFITFSSGDSGTLKLQLTSQVLPAEPSTLITLESPPIQIIADGADTKTITTFAIRDKFGNIVSDGTPVSLGTNNLTLVGSNTVNTINGIISFQVRATTQRGDATVSIFSGDAAGFLRMQAIAGPPSGTITVDAYSPELIANGVSQLVFKTGLLRDQFNNIVEDGTEIYFSIQGGGTLSSGSATTLLGTAKITLTAPTVKGSAVIQIRGGPYDDGGSTAYTASGDFPITYIPGPPAGNIPVISSLGGIYAVENEVDANGSPTQTALSVGPVVDAQGNVVRTNTEVSILMNNGVNLSVAVEENPVSFFTDSSGMIYFNVAGAGERGPITITATSSSAFGTKSIWAFKDDNIFDDPVEDNMQVYIKYFSDTSNPSPTLPWGEFTNLTGIEAELDTSTFKFYKKNSSIPIQFAYNLPDFMWDCFFTKGKKVFSHPCERRPEPGESTQYQFYRDVFPMEFNASISNGSALTGFVGIDRDSGGNVFDNSHDSSVNWPAFGYNPNVDKGIIFGGGHWEDFQNQNILYKYANQESVPFTSSLLTILNGFDTTVDITVSNKTQEDGDSGDHPPNMLGMQLAPVGDDLFGFGGMSPFGTGTPFNSFYNFNFNTSRWTNVSFQDDPTISESRNPLVKGTSSSPSGRYQHGMTFIPETNSLYLLSGLELNFEIPAWRKTNDLWKLDFSPLDQPGSELEDLTWDRLCDGDLSSTYCPACDFGDTDEDDPTCGHVQSGVCRNFDGDDIGFSTEPDANSSCIWPSAHGQIQSPSGGDIKKTFMVWHHIYQKAFIFWADNPTVKEFDPYTESVIDTSRSIQNMGNKFQVFYNKEEGRTFSYQRISGSNSILYFWDMEPGEKTYIKLDVDIGAGSKNFAQSIVPNIRAWGQTDTGSGVNVFVYNYDTSTWVLWQSTNAIDQSSSELLTGALTNPTEYVSTEGKLTFLITPKGEASTFNNLDFDFVFISGRF